MDFYPRKTLSDLLTINSVFSAILITYLFSRITWTKDRKLDTFNDAIEYSQKITEFRRIVERLTRYYNVWNNDNATISLFLDQRFKNIDYYDFYRRFTTTNPPSNKELLDELESHPDFVNGKSQLYLAMISLVYNRKIERVREYPNELYKDFEYQGVYNIRHIERWIESNIMGTIWYWLDRDVNWINYRNLSRQDRDYILAAATRIDESYSEYELNNDLIRELADDMSEFYLNELSKRLKYLKKGIENLNLLILGLISFSLIFGVLSPFVLLLIGSQKLWFFIIAAIISSINAGLISYFIIKFPSLINSEIKWIK